MMEYWSNGPSQHSITPVLQHSSLFTPALHHSSLFTPLLRSAIPPRGLSQHQVQQPVHMLP